MASDAILYSMENVGILQTSKSDATISMLENMGLAVLPPDRSSTMVLLENVGFLPPPILNVQKPQMGWGTPVVPTREVRMLPEAAVATLPLMENVIE